MGTNVGTLQAQLNLNYTNFHNGMDQSVKDAKNLGSALQNAFNGFSPNTNAVIKQAQALSQQLSNIFSTTQANVKLVMDASNFESTAYEVNQWVDGLKETLSTGLSGITPHIDTQQAQADLDNFKSIIAETRAYADQQLQNIRPSIHIGNANRSLNTIQQNITNLRANAQPIEMQVRVNTTEVSQALQQITLEAQQAGQTISQTLGGLNAQGFSSASQAFNDMASALNEIISKASTFEATMQNMNQTLQQVTAVKTYTSQLAEEFGKVATMADTAAESVRNLGDQLYDLLSLLEALTGGHSYVFEDMARQMQNLNAYTAAFSQSLSDAKMQLRSLSGNTKGNVTAMDKLSQKTDKVVSNLQSSVDWATRLKTIISGIVISQAFYQITGTIRSWVDQAKAFSMEMEQAAIAFKYLLGSADEASAFIEALQDFAVQSPLDTEGADKAARLLMTMGINAKNTIPVLRVLTDTAVVAGGELEDAVYRISLALGQMLQSGTVKMQEIRQLVNANVPIFEILQEELGLTAQQISQIGKEGVDSVTAVNAILRGLQKRFGGAALEMQSTVKGAISAIKDSFFILFNLMTSVPYEWIREKLVSISEALQLMAKIARKLGPGGLFEAIFSPRAQIILRNLAGALGQLGYAFKYAAILIASVFGDALKMMITLLSIVLPPITILANAVMQLAVYFYKSSPMVRFFVAALINVAVTTKILIPLLIKLWSILGFSKLFLAARNMVLAFGKALQWLVASPIHLAIAGLLALVAIIAYVTGAFNALITKIKSVIAWWLNLNKTLNSKLKIGYDPNSMFKPWSDKTNKNNADDYLGQLQDIDSKMKDIGDSAEKTKKKLKQSFLQSFDEVYQIKPNDDDSDQTAADLGLDDYDFPIDIFAPIDDDILSDVGKLKDILGDLFDIPSADWWNNWRDVFKNWPDWLPEALAAALGAIIGAVLGGGKGALIGAALGLLCGWLWQKLADLLGIRDKNWAMAASALFAALLALLIFALTGSQWAAALAGIIGWFAGLFWEKIAEAFGLTEAQKKQALISSTIGATLGSLIGYALGGKIGAILGGTIGIFVGEFWSILCDKLGYGEGAKYAGLLAGGIGGVLAAALTHSEVVNALMAAAPKLGEFLVKALGGGVFNAATTVGLVTTWAAALAQGIEQGNWSGLVPAITGTLGRVILGPIGAWIGELAGYFYNITFEQLQEKFGISNSAQFADVITALIAAVITGVKAWMVPIISQMGTSIGEVSMQALKNGLQGGFAGLIVSLVASGLSNLLIGWLADEFDKTSEDVANGKVGGAIGGVLGSIVGAFFGPLGAMIGNALGTILGSVIGLFAGSIAEWFHGWWDPFAENVWDSLVKFFTETIPGAWESLKEWVASIPEKVAEFFGGIGEKIGEFFGSTVPYYLGYAVGVIARGFVDIIKTIGQFFVDAYNAFIEFFTVTIPAAWETFKEGWNTFWTVTFPSVIDSIGQFFVDAYNSFIEFFTVTIPEAWESFKEGWAEFWSVTFPEVIESIGQFFVDAYNAFIAFFTETLPEAWESFKEGWNEFWEVTFPGVIDSIGQFFEDLWKDFVEWGKNLVEGFWQGIEDTWNSLVAAIGGWVDNFIQGFKDGFGIHSPSKVMSGIGNFLVEGLLGGISDLWGDLTGTMSDWIANLTGDVAEGFNIVKDNITTWAVDTGTEISNWSTQTWESISGCVNDVGASIKDWTTTAAASIATWSANGIAKVKDFASQGKQNITSFANDARAKVTTWGASTRSTIQQTTANGISKLANFCSTTKANISSWKSTLLSTASSWASSFASKVGSGCSNALSKISSFVSSAASKLSSWASSMASTISSVLSSAASAASSALSRASSFVSSKLAGHATGGIYNREHIARISEGNKSEAIIPLQNDAAMQPFVDAVSKGLTETLAPIVAKANSGGDDRTPVYVGTLIADERGLKELERKMKVIRLKDERRS